jgi:hypothetical protein
MGALHQVTCYLALFASVSAFVSPVRKWAFFQKGCFLTGFFCSFSDGLCQENSGRVRWSLTPDLTHHTFNLLPALLTQKTL